MSEWDRKQARRWLQWGESRAMVIYFQCRKCTLPQPARRWETVWRMWFSKSRHSISHARRKFQLAETRIFASCTWLFKSSLDIGMDTTDSHLVHWVNPSITPGASLNVQPDTRRALCVVSTWLSTSWTDSGIFDSTPSWHSATWEFEIKHDITKFWSQFIKRIIKCLLIPPKSVYLNPSL